MERLTKKNPGTNLERLLNFAIAKDKQVVLDYGFEKKPLVQVVVEKAKSMDCDATEQAVMYEGKCMECDCAVALMNMLGIQAAELHARLSLIEDILGNVYDLDRLRELVKADRDGRCVVMPCKLHDKVFFVENGCVKETEVDSFHNWTSGRWKISIHTDRMFDHWKGYEIDFSGIGKTVFLTREEAEAKLKERENNG